MDPLDTLAGLVEMRTTEEEKDMCKEIAARELNENNILFWCGIEKESDLEEWQQWIKMDVFAILSSDKNDRSTSWVAVPIAVATAVSLSMFGETFDASAAYVSGMPIGR